MSDGYERQMVPASRAFAVTGSDTVDLTIIPRGVYVGVSGDVKVTMQGGDVVTFTGLAAGVVHPIRPKRVWATGTTATSILGVY